MVLTLMSVGFHLDHKHKSQNRKAIAESELRKRYKQNGQSHRDGDTYLDFIEKEQFCFNKTLISRDANLTELCNGMRSQRKEYFKKRPNKVNMFNHTFVIKTPNRCWSDVDMIVVVHTLHEYADRRYAIRETWANLVSRGMWPNSLHFDWKVKVIFSLGLSRDESWNSQIKKEAEKYGDIIQGDFTDSYRNMTLKSLLDLKWVTQFCPKAKYFLKSDDDMIINFPHLFNILSSMNFSNSIMGPLNVGSRTMRGGKWKLTREEYPFYYLPMYESGSAYVISADVVQSLYDSASHVPMIFIDDVYITGILAEVLGIKHVRQSGFAYWTSKRPTACEIVENKVVTGTKMIGKALRDLWDELDKSAKCNVPITTTDNRNHR